MFYSDSNLWFVVAAIILASAHLLAARMPQNVVLWNNDNNDRKNNWELDQVVDLRIDD